MARRVLVQQSEALTASEVTVISDAVTELGMASSFHSHSLNHSSAGTLFSTCTRAVLVKVVVEVRRIHRGMPSRGIPHGMHFTFILVERPSQHSMDRDAASEDLRDLRKMTAGKKGRNRGVMGGSWKALAPDRRQPKPSRSLGPGKAPQAPFYWAVGTAHCCAAKFTLHHYHHLNGSKTENGHTRFTSTAEWKALIEFNPGTHLPRLESHCSMLSKSEKALC